MLTNVMFRTLVCFSRLFMCFTLTSCVTVLNLHVLNCLESLCSFRYICTQVRSKRRISPTTLCTCKQVTWSGYEYSRLPQNDRLKHLTTDHAKGISCLSGLVGGRFIKRFEDIVKKGLNGYFK